MNDSSNPNAVKSICNQCGESTLLPPSLAASDTRCACGGKLIFPAAAHLEAVRENSNYPTVRKLAGWLTWLAIVGAVLLGLVLVSQGRGFDGLAVTVCGGFVALAIRAVVMLADVADLLADFNRRR